MVWRHPNYYKELSKIRKQFEKEQADKATRQQAIEETVPHIDIEEANKPTSAQEQVDKRPSQRPQGSGANLPSQDE